MFLETKNHHLMCLNVKKHGLHKIQSLYQDIVLKLKIFLIHLDNKKNKNQKYTILYGINLAQSNEITKKVYEKCVNNNYIIIPANDQSRNNLFCDYYVNQKKYIIVQSNGTNYYYEKDCEVCISLLPL